MLGRVRKGEEAGNMEVEKAQTREAFLVCMPTKGMEIIPVRPHKANSRLF